jgi:hypothetical protein
MISLRSMWRKRYLSRVLVLNRAVFGTGMCLVTFSQVKCTMRSGFRRSVRNDRGLVAMSSHNPLNAGLRDPDGDRAKKASTDPS